MATFTNPCFNCHTNCVLLHSPKWKIPVGDQGLFQHLQVRFQLCFQGKVIDSLTGVVKEH